MFDVTLGCGFTSDGPLCLGGSEKHPYKPIPYPKKRTNTQ